jgi:histidinol dehydrogenase
VSLIRTLDFREKNLSKNQYQQLLPRAEMDIAAAMKTVEPILKAVKDGNEETLISLCEKFDGTRPKEIKVPRKELKKALSELDPKVRKALLVSIGRIKKVHKEQSRKEKRTQVVPGGSVIQKWIPVDRVGLYVPGGNAVYPSSVIMNVIPAQVAKVPSIAVASPPQVDNNGYPNKIILATCELLGISEVYAIGGAQAVAMFAYGVPNLCEPVDMVTGPGNIYVAAAKRALRGKIGIDSEAGPTEVAIIADKFADAKSVAADLISQAEHDVIAAALLITDSEKLAKEVESELFIRAKITKHSSRILEALSGRQSAIVLVKDIKQAVDVANAYAAEHLEIQTKKVDAVAKKIRNAGAIFVGRYSPVSLGDYSAGSNHVLPTGGCACHSSGLSVQSFLKGVNIIKYNQKAFKNISNTVITLANSEDLPAHGEAMSARFEKKTR